MLAASVAGVWAAAPHVAWNYRWAPTTPSTVQHDFLVVRRRRDGGLTVFRKNREENTGAFIGERTVSLSGRVLSLRRAGRPDIAGLLNPDGTLSVDNVRYHRATSADMRYFLPSSSPRWTYHAPRAMADGWNVGRLADVRMRLGPLRTFFQGIVSARTPTLTTPSIHSVTVERHGTIVLDDYFFGFRTSDTHDVRSAGKSVTTLLVGRAIEDTGAFSPRSRIVDLLRRYRPLRNEDDRKDRMTVGNLMTMSSGLACDDNDDASPGNEDVMQSRPAGTDWYRYTLDLPMVAAPGSEAVYCSAGINLLGGVVEVATHRRLLDYFSERFARPMQFGPYGMWLMNDPAGVPYMAGGDHFRPRDFLKFGALLLNRGHWNGRAIVDGEWIAESVVPRTAPKGEGDRYGFGWHVTRVRVDGRDVRVVSAGGNGGQLLVVLPDFDVAVMMTAGNYGQYRVWRSFLPSITRAVVESCDEGARPRAVRSRS